MTNDYELLSLSDHGYVERSRQRRSCTPDALAEDLLRTYLDVADKFCRLARSSPEDNDIAGVKCRWNGVLCAVGLRGVVHNVAMYATR
jgi:hypothetical protein